MVEAHGVLAPQPMRIAPDINKFHKGNGEDGKHYWLTPPELLSQLTHEFNFDFDPCPHPKAEDFDGLTVDWGQSNYVNPPFGSIIHNGRKKGPTAWVRKAIAEQQKGRDVVLVYPIDKWILMLIEAADEIRNLGDVRWIATEDGSQGKGTGRHIACFILRGSASIKENIHMDEQALREAEGMRITANTPYLAAEQSNTGKCSRLHLDGSRNLHAAQTSPA